MLSCRRGEMSAWYRSWKGRGGRAFGSVIRGAGAWAEPHCSMGQDCGLARQPKTKRFAYPCVERARGRAEGRLERGMKGQYTACTLDETESDDHLIYAMMRCRVNTCTECNSVS